MSSQSDYETTKELLKLSDSQEELDWESALQSANEALDVASENKFHELEAKALFKIANLHYYNIDRKTTLPYFERGYEAVKLSKNKGLEYKYLMEMGKYHLYVTSDMVEAKAYFLDAIQISKKLKKHQDTARAYAKLAIIYVKKKDSEKVLDCLEKSNQYFRNSDSPKDAAYYYCDIGTRVWEYNMDLAVDLYLKALEIDERHYYPNMCIGDAYIALGLPEASIPHLQISIDSLGKDTWKYSFAMTNLAKANFLLENYSAADSICEDLIKFLSPKNNEKKKSLPTAYLIRGKIEELKGNTDEAIQYYTTSLQSAETLKRTLLKVEAMVELGQIYATLDPDLSNKYCNQAYEEATKYDFTQLQSNACDCLYLSYKQKENYDLALSYLEKKDKLEKSLNVTNATQKLNVLEKLGQRDSEIEYERILANERYNSQLTTNKILLFTLILGFVLLFLLGNMMRKIKKQNDEINVQSEELKEINDNLIQSNEELERFAYITSHDLKTPMLIITQFSKLLGEKLSDMSDPVIKDCIKYIDEGSERMTKLIDGVLEFSKTSSDSSNIAEINMRHLLNEISSLSINKDKPVEITVDYDSMPNITWNYTRILLLFKNLVENGLKYNTSEVPQIIIYAEEQEDHHLIYIKDNGIGIEAQFHDKIFVMFNRLHNQKEYKGSGLGLATCKKIVDNFGGEITLESVANEGSTFIIKFPNSMVIKNEAVPA